MSLVPPRLATLAARARQAVTGLLDPRTDIDDPDPTRPFGRGHLHKGIAIVQPYEDEDIYATYGHVDPAHFIAAVTDALDSVGYTPGECRTLTVENVHHEWVRVHETFDDDWNPYTDIVSAQRGDKGAVAITTIEVEYF